MERLAGVLLRSPVGFAFLCLAAGVCLQGLLAGPWPLAAVAAASAAGLWAGWRRLANAGSDRAAALAIASACGLMVAVGGGMRLVKQRWIERLEANCTAPSDWQPARLLGHVDSIPRFFPDTSPWSVGPGGADEPKWITLVDIAYHAAVETTAAGPRPLPSEGRMRLTIPGRHRGLAPGDAVDVLVRWRRVPPPSNPGEFDLAERLKHAGVLSQGRAKSAAAVRENGRPQWWRPSRYIGRLAMAGDAAIERHVGFGQAPLAAALVIGQRDQIDAGLEQTLLETGTIHMLAISGLHVEMVALSVAVLCLAVGLSQRKTLVIVASTVVAYAVLCGSNPPVIRAALLVVLYAVAKYRGLPIRSFNLLAVVALVLMLYRVDRLWDVGTQLSFLAVAMLMYLAAQTRGQRLSRDPLDRLVDLHSSPLRKAAATLGGYAADSVRVSFWVWLVTTPIVLATFHVVAPVAIVLNLLLLAPLWVGLLSGLLVMLIGPWAPAVAAPFGWLCGLTMALVQAVVEAARLVPLGHWWTAGPPVWWPWAFYALLLALLAAWGFGRRARPRIAVAMTLALLTGILPWGEWFGPRAGDGPPTLAVTFIDVGHGTSVVVETPEGECWLYDAGKMGSESRAFEPIAATLWHARRGRIDRLILSHADADHYNAVFGLAERFAIGQVITTPQFAASEDPRVQEVWRLLQRHAGGVRIVAAGERIDCGGVQAMVLHPAADRSFGTDNADSLSLLLEHADHRFLLPGDLEARGLQALLSLPPARVDVLMAPHHGSLADDPEGLLGWSHPDHVVISGGPRASRLKVLTAYAGPAARDVWVTSRDHAIRFEAPAGGPLRAMRWSGGAWVPLQTRALEEPAEDEPDGYGGGGFRSD